MIKRKINFPIKLAPPLRAGAGLVTASIIILMVLFFIIGRTVRTLKTLDYFKIKDIILSKSEEGADFSYLIGRNIFNLDLEKESRYISELYPAYKRVRLIRVLPKRLFVGFTERKPKALVKLYRYFFVDSELVLFNGLGGYQEIDLPVIIGLETKIFGAKTGRQYNIKELALALNIIEELQINNILKEYKVKRVDVVNPANTSFFLQLSDYTEGQAITKQGVLEVKIGQEDTDSRIRILGSLFNQLKNDLGNIKYIDLRFKDPVIKFK